MVLTSSNLSPFPKLFQRKKKKFPINQYIFQIPLVCCRSILRNLKLQNNVSQIWKKMLTKRIDFTRTHFNADSLFVIYLL